MIKQLGMAVFGLIGLAGIVFGVLRNEPVSILMGGFALGLIVLTALAIRIFPTFFESEENAKVGMQVIKKAITGTARHGGD